MRFPCPHIIYADSVNIGIDGTYYVFYSIIL